MAPAAALADGLAAFLRSTAVGDLVVAKQRIAEVPYTSTVGDVLQTMLMRDVTAVPVAAPPGEFIGAGGSSILDSDPRTGIVRKQASACCSRISFPRQAPQWAEEFWHLLQYIGIVDMLDVLIHLAEITGQEAGEEQLETPVESIIGHSMEGLSLWAMGPSTSLYDALEPLSKGVHRMLVPFEPTSPQERTGGIELSKTATSYRMVTQTDVIRSLVNQGGATAPILSETVDSLQLVNHSVFAVPSTMLVLDVVRCMQQASIQSVAVVEPTPDITRETMLAKVMGQGRRLLGNFSASDLRGCTAKSLRSLSSVTVETFFRRMEAETRHSQAGASTRRIAVVCQPGSQLGAVLQEALTRRAHRAWMVDGAQCLLGVITFSQVLKAARQAAMTSGTSVWAGSCTEIW
eukprot:SM000019S04938  [mRNA]  locus=s19:168584:171635:+ [translate_table: standard]